MKKTFLILMLALAVTAAFAQEEEEQDWRQELRRHEVGIGIGDPCLAMLYRPYNSPYINVASPDNTWFTTNRYYHGPYYTTCPLTFHYLFRVTKFLWLGGNFSYCGVYAKRYGMDDRYQIGYMNEHYVTVLQTIRFSYLNKKYVTLYSGLGTGFTLAIVPETDGPFRLYNVNCYPAIQITAFGVSAGDNWYGYTEVGAGYNGFIRAGFGYRFNREKK